jgi:sulfoxide reductase heme-binding subunit YedZ
MVALWLSSASVSAGLWMSTGNGRGRRSELRALHEALSLCTLAAVAVHGVSLLFDSFFHPGIAGIAVPFAGSYRPTWTGIGVVAGYGLVLLGLTYYARERLGPAGWRRAHQFTAVFWGLGIAHSIGAGSDRGTTWFLAALVAISAPAAALLLVRVGRALGAYLDLPRTASPVQVSERR